ncbi:SPX domain-containing protein [Lipomyces japonicus]|uniref:SPX domain-containing protein n=1 Tax=Lipomyces japonicus TaxID=56871 RepID=UPI0034CF812B
MKFAKVFQQLLDEENIPKEWVSAAIQYKALKKCINKVVSELEELGLEKETLQLLLAYENAQRSSSSGGGPRPKLIYSFEGSLHEFVPKISINLDAVNGTPLSAEISADTRIKLQKLIAKANAAGAKRDQPYVQVVSTDHDDDDEDDNDIFISDRQDVEIIRCDHDKRERRLSYEYKDMFDADNSLHVRGLHNTHAGTVDDNAGAGDANIITGTTRTIEIHLHSDSEFFHMLCSELAALDSLQEEQQKIMSDEVVQLSRKLPYVTSPFQKKNDLYVWREIFRLYIDAGVFFSSVELDHGERNADKAKEQLMWFTNELENMNLLKRFKLKESKELFEQFWNINLSLLQSMQFQSLNQTAMTKILKKFDKQTALSSRQVFPNFYFNNPVFMTTAMTTAVATATTTVNSASSSIAKSVCFAMADQLLTIIPQLDDYICPVCYLLAFKPVRLDCGHVFCIRCLVKLQRQNKDNCPICRQKVLLSASGRNIDTGLYNHLLLYFPKEAKQKQIANDREVVKEQLNVNDEQKCVIM